MRDLILQLSKSSIYSTKPQLAQGSAAQSRQLNQANIRWSEAQQRSPQFNEAICQALAAAVAKKK
ncbi:hypothetical protein ABLX73_22660, partial [Klebsiella sp. JB_Kp005]